MSTEPSAALIISGILMATLAFTLIPRGLGASKLLRMVGAWVGIFALFFLLFSFRGPVEDAWHAATREFSSRETSGPGGVVRIPRDSSGHFIAKVEVNGHEVAMLVDTGATVTVFPEAMARNVGISIDKSGFPVFSSTANGMVKDWRARVDRLGVGGIVRNDFPVHVTEGDLGGALLGMNWLTTLKSWRVEGSTLVLEP